MKKIDNPKQIEIKFTWNYKIIISMKQIMKEAKKHLLSKTFFWDDDSNKCLISWKDAVKHTYGQYRDWKALFIQSGNILTMPSFAYFQD